MTQRIGLRHMPRIVRKAPSVCPTGEQIVNGGFENDKNGWYDEIEAPYQAIIVTDNVHSGAKAASTPKIGANYDIFRLSQDVDNIPAYCISEISCWYYTWGITNTNRFRVTYTDDTYTEAVCNVQGVWTKQTITPTAGKIVKKITLRKSSTGTRFDFDDVSLVCTG